MQGSKTVVCSLEKVDKVKKKLVSGPVCQSSGHEVQLDRARWARLYITRKSENAGFWTSLSTVPAQHELAKGLHPSNRGGPQ